MRCFSLSASALGSLVLLASIATAQDFSSRMAIANGRDNTPGYLPAAYEQHQTPPPISAAGGPATAMESVCQQAAAPSQLGAQVFFRGGVSWMTGRDRGGEVFSDTLGAAGFRNDGDTGYSFGFGFQLPLMKDPIFGNTILAEVLMNYSQFSNKQVVTTTSALVGAPVVDNIPLTQFVVSGSPKYQLTCLGDFRPWLIPVGMAMLVNSPPTNKTTYLDMGLQFAVGADYRLTQNISVGVDCRYFYNLHRPNASWLTSGVYLGFDF